MPSLLLCLLAIGACTTTTAPEPPVASGEQAEVEAAADDTGISPRAPGKLAATMRHELNDDPDAPGSKAPPPCDGISAELARAVAGDTSGLELDGEGRVQVTYEFTGTPEGLPSGFVQETSAMGHGQGWCPPAQLCELAAVAGIDRVRTVRRASPK